MIYTASQKNLSSTHIITVLGKNGTATEFEAKIKLVTATIFFPVATKQFVV